MPPIRISPSVISSSPATIRSTLVLPQPDGPTKTTNSPSPISRSRLLDRARPVGVDLLQPFERRSQPPATSSITLPRARSARRAPRTPPRSWSSAKRCVTSRPGRTRLRVQQRDDVRPGGGGVAEAGREREVVVDEHVGGELEHRAGGGEAEIEDDAAAAERAHRRDHAPAVAPAASIARSKPPGGAPVVKPGRAERERELLAGLGGARRRGSPPATRARRAARRAGRSCRRRRSSTRRPGRGRTFSSPVSTTAAGSTSAASSSGTASSSTCTTRAGTRIWSPAPPSRVKPTSS